MRHCFWPLLILIVLQAAASDTDLKETSYRVRLHVPLTEYADLTNAWIQIDGCPRPEECETLIDRIPVRELVSFPTLHMEIDNHGTVSVSYSTDKEAKTILIAKTNFKNGWMLPMELCRYEGVQLGCRVRVTKDEELQSYTLKVDPL